MSLNYLEKSAKYKDYHYSVLSNDMLDYIHFRTIEMAKEVVRIFSKHNIRYFICGGTLLGAFTTGHFIPWDDDIDICILEDDYDKMLNILSVSLPDSMILQNEITEPNYYHGWAKVRDGYSTIYPNEPRYQYNGVWIDLYKLSLVKRKEVNYLVTKEHFDYLKRRLNHDCISEDEYKKRIQDNDLPGKLKEAQLIMQQDDDDSEVFLIWSASKVQVDKNWCFPSKLYVFEGVQFASFNNPLGYLERHYGKDFQQLPPYEQRCIGINKVVFLNVF